MKILQQNQSLICEKFFPTDFANHLFPNLMLFQILLFSLHFGKFVNSLLNYPQKERSLQKFKSLFPVILRIFDHECHGETSLEFASVQFDHVFMKLRKLESLHQENIKLLSPQNRSSHRRCSVRKSVFRNFAKFTGKHLCQSLFFNKVADLNISGRLYFHCISIPYSMSKNY